MKVLYIGHYNEGSTSRMRGEYIKDILSINEFQVVNIDIPLAETGRVFRSLGWRYKIGPLIKNINNHIINSVKGNYGYDLVWIDKGVFIDPEIIFKLKSNSNKLVHFTPDPAFTYHQSKLFYQALNQYDYCVTTKSFEIENYKAYNVNTLFCTQGYDPKLHRSYHNWEEKKGVVFIGHREEEREYIIAKLIEAKIQVTIAGNHWNRFARKQQNNKSLIYKGKGVYGHQYAKELSGAYMGLGLLSKWIPELHTTRTFEIPACNTALVTEKNSEISSVFLDNEAIYYNDADEVVSKVSYYLAHAEELKTLTIQGHQKVINGGYSYVEILKKIIKKMEI